MIFFLVLLFFVLEYVRPGNYIPGLDLLRLNSLVPIAAILATLMSKERVPRDEVLKDVPARLLIAFVGMIVASFVVAQITFYAFEVFTMVAGYVMVFWLLTQHVSDYGRVKKVMLTLIGVHLFLAAMTPEMFTDSSQRHYLTSGTFLSDGNDYALSVNICMPFCLFLLFDTKSLAAKIGYGLVLLALTMCVVVTQSRGGTLAMAAMALYFWTKSERKATTAALSVVAIVVVMAVAPPAYFQRMNSIQSYQEDGSAQGRLIAWGAGMRMAMSNPLLGVGAGQFPVNYTRFAVSPTGEAETRWKTAHSIYFLILGELALPGLAILIGLIYFNLLGNSRVLKQIKELRTPEADRARQLLTCMNASVMAYAIGGAFLSAAYYPHIFVLSGLCFASRRFALQAVTAQQPTQIAAAAGHGLTLHWALRPTHASHTRIS